jgi:heme-degrading monooxygenase HmoA
LTALRLRQNPRESKETYMSVLVTVRIKADPARLEEFAAANGEMIKAISEDGRSKGAIHHRFYGGDGEVLVVDEWDSAESFQAFFGGQADIPKVMEGAGAEGEPEITFRRPLETGDDF